MYFVLKESKESALAAAKEHVAGIRSDWGVEQTPEMTVQRGDVGPIYRDRLSGRPIEGIIVRAHGERARSGERYLGEARWSCGWAWEE